MSAQEPQVVDPVEFIALTDYNFSGDSETVANKCRIVEGYRLKASIYHAAQFAGVHRATVYRYLDNDPQFALAMEDSFEDAADVAESSVYERAIGRNCKPDSLLAMFWLKAHRPKYRDRVAVDVEVVRSEIEERMSQINLRQMPPAITQFLAPEVVNGKQFPPQPAQIQKEDTGSSSSELDHND